MYSKLSMGSVSSPSSHKLLENSLTLVFLLKNPVAVNVPFVADCEQTRQRVIEGSNGVDTSENVDYLYYIGT